jgi:hypothetical protein
MKEIVLTNGKIALVDDEDFEELSEIKWYFRKEGYAVGNLPSPKKGVYPKQLMHRHIMSAKKGQQIDHINGNKLDNRKCNLRIADASLNQANSKLRSTNTTGYRGVQYKKDRKKCWYATIKHNYKVICLGYFETKKEAGLAYNEKAKELFGEFARLNVID